MLQSPKLCVLILTAQPGRMGRVLPTAEGPRQPGQGHLQGEDTALL